jgi:leucyl/phenylalanyl-tRNA--protein transferase
MPVYRLGPEPIFPPPEEAEPDGLLAVGGDLSVPRLLEAYCSGIFPWYDEPPILWWSPDPRLVLFPRELRVSRSLRATIRKGTFEVRFDTAFRRVIHACASTPRKDDPGTWITREVEAGYSALHDLGFAHSAESWAGGELVGGLYGVCLGRCFFGESMFSRRPDASKVALVGLVDELTRRGVELIDCQVTTEHLLSLGAREIPRSEFLRRLDDLLRHPTDRTSWARPPAGDPSGQGPLTDRLSVE